ncbi:6001_t:CDS:2, partial [Funneliformis geosporum]
RVYNSPTICKLINKFMKDGKKEKAEKIVYEAAQKVEKWWTKEESQKKLNETKEKKTSKETELKEPPVEAKKSEKEKVLPNAEFDLEMVRGKPVRITEEIIHLSNNTGKLIEKKLSVYQAARRAKGFAYSIPNSSSSAPKT